jgi:hypothetical protein
MRARAGRVAGLAALTALMMFGVGVNCCDQLAVREENNINKGSHESSTQPRAFGIWEEGFTVDFLFGEVCHTLFETSVPRRRDTARRV